jgi:hypothetical protein
MHRWTQVHTRCVTRSDRSLEQKAVNDRRNGTLLFTCRRKPSNLISQPHTGARYPVSKPMPQTYALGNARQMCFFFTFGNLPS